MPLLPPAIAAADLVTGERLQALCDCTVTSAQIISFHSSLPDAVTRVTLPDLFADPEARPPASSGLAGMRQRFQARSSLRRIGKRLAAARSIFVYTHLLPAFITHVLPRLTKPFVLMTHNSDELVTGRFKPLLEDCRLKRWFASSAVISHPKLECLPIGMANAQWQHGDIAKMAAEMAKRQPKTQDLYVNFTPQTHPSRAPLQELLRARGFAVGAPTLSYEDYLGELGRHRYCVSPLGNGFDAHRTWESLLVGTVPVVASEIAAIFPGLPMLGVSNWNEVTSRFLDQAYERFDNAAFDFNRLRLSWWRARVHDAVLSG